MQDEIASIVMLLPGLGSTKNGKTGSEIPSNVSDAEELTAVAVREALLDTGSQCSSRSTVISPLL